MALGFASAQGEQAKQSAKQVTLTPIAEIQANLSSYFSDKTNHPTLYSIPR